MHWKTKTIANVLLAAALAGLFLLGLEAYRAGRASVVSRERVLTARDTQVKAADLLAALAEAVSISLGYVVTGEPELLEQQATTLAEMAERMRQLRQLLGDHPELGENAAVLERLVREREQILRRQVALRQSDGKEAAEAFVASADGSASDQSIKRLVVELRRSGTLAMEELILRSERDTTHTFLLLATSLFTVLGVVVASFALTRREIKVRRQASAALERQAQRLRELYDHAPTGYCSLSCEGRVVAMNETLARMVGRPREEVENCRTLAELLGESSKPGADQLAQRLAVSEESVSEELEFARPDGTTFTATVSARRRRGAEAQQEFCLVSVVDISDRKRAEQILVAARRNAESVFDAVDAPLVLLRSNLEVHTANRSFHDAFKCAVPDVIGKRFDELAGQRFAQPSLLEKVHEALATNSSFNDLRVTIPRPDPQEVGVFEAAGRVLPSLSSGKTMLLLRLRDVTEREAFTTSLIESQRMFRRLFENSPDAMLLVDSERTVVRANMRAQELFGWKEGSISARKIEELMPERFRGRHVGHMAMFFRDPRARSMGRGLELLGLRQDGTEFPVDIMLSPLETERGLQVLAVIRDISERAAAEKRIQELNGALRLRAREMEMANEELEAFSYSVSHDLRAPLRHVTGFAEMLRLQARDSLDPKSQRYLDTILESARRMGLLIEDLLAFSRVARTQLSHHEIAMSVLFDEVRTGLMRESQGRRISWEIQALPTVSGDHSMLRQVVYNLLANAVKYTRKRPLARIEVGTFVQGAAEVVFYVRDNGAGFDMKYADRLFGVFQRLHAISEFEGTGVGLAIVRRIVQRHGGRTWAEGSVDVGATFYFSLPVSSPPNS